MKPDFEKSQILEDLILDKGFTIDEVVKQTGIPLNTIISWFTNCDEKNKERINRYFADSRRRFGRAVSLSNMGPARNPGPSCAISEGTETIESKAMDNYSDLPAYTLYAEGKCIYKLGIGGWGYILEGPNCERIANRGVAVNTTNNEMEVTAVAEGLSAIEQPARVTVICSNGYVISGLTHGMLKWSRDSRKNRPVSKCRDLWQRIVTLSAQHKLYPQKIGKFSENQQSNRCHREALNAIKVFRINNDLANGVPTEQEAPSIPLQVDNLHKAQDVSGTPIQATLYADGSCIGNPGPGGWAFLAKDATTGEETVKSGGVAYATNNQMEMIAVIEGLSSFKEPTHIEIASDSSYVIDGISQWMADWKRTNWLLGNGKLRKNADLWQKLDVLSQFHTLSFKKIKGHSGDKQNELCDSLALREAQKFRNDPNVQTMLYTAGFCDNRTRAGGWAFLAKNAATGEEVAKYEGCKQTTSNRMEMIAVINGLSSFKEPTHIEIISTNSYVINGMSQWMKSWKRNGWCLKNGEPCKNADLWRKLDALAHFHKLSFKQVAENSEIEPIKLCTTLASGEAHNFINNCF